MSRVRPLTHVEREMRADEAAIQGFSESFMEALRVECARRNMDWQDFERVIDVSHSTLAQWKKGKIGSSSLGMVIKAARRAGIPLAQNESHR